MVNLVGPLAGASAGEGRSGLIDRSARGLSNPGRTGTRAGAGAGWESRVTVWETVRGLPEVCWSALTRSSTADRRPTGSDRRGEGSGTAGQTAQGRGTADVRI